jgi:hypothetical protein
MTQQLHETFHGPLHAPLSINDYSNWPHYDIHGVLIPSPTQWGYPVEVTHIADGQLTGCVGYNCGVGLMNITTVWVFAKPLLAFGATFQYSDRQPQSKGILSLNFQDGFFGFISTEPLTKFAFQVADNPFGNCGSPCRPPTTHFAMESLYAQVQSGQASIPEPSTGRLLAFLGVTLGGGFLAFNPPKKLGVLKRIRFIN